MKILKDRKRLHIVINRLRKNLTIGLSEIEDLKQEVILYKKISNRHDSNWDRGRIEYLEDENRTLSEDIESKTQEYLDLKDKHYKLLAAIKINN